ncbi:MAG: hypothetical protein H6737_00745 [Alphaproteobacteria bacterium]|nr:hypothetical protein [Alphaproteobacteria bacterium]
MLGLYLAALGFGSVLIGVSLFFGGADKDFDKDFDVEADHDVEVDSDVDADADVDVDADADVDLDVDHDVDLDVEADAEVDLEAEAEADLDKDVSGLADAVWIPLLSMRFWTFGSAAFGFTGTALTLGGLPWLVVLALATVFGGTTGTGAAYFFRALKKDSVSSETTLKSYSGEEAQVLLPIEPGRRGKIALDTPSGRLDMVAETRDAEPIPRGSTVIVASVRDGVANVSALDSPRGSKIRQRAAARAAKQRA